MIVSREEYARLTVERVRQHAADGKPWLAHIVEDDAFVRFAVEVANDRESPHARVASALLALRRLDYDKWAELPPKGPE